MKIESFRGLDNVHAGEEEHRLKPGDLIVASNCDITNKGEIKRREGFEVDTAGAYANAWKGTVIQLATFGDVLINAANGATLHSGLLGVARMWYAELPDGRVVYTNGVDCGVVGAEAASRATWGVPIPASIGVGADAGGGTLPSGEYRYCLTHRRTTDGLQGGAIDSGRVSVTTGALAITGIPTLADHTTQVWITTADGTDFYLAGSTSGTTYTHTSPASKDVKCLTRFMVGPDMIDGILPAVWRGRVLLAVANVLYASAPRTSHLFNIRSDFRSMDGTITFIGTVENGIWVGTTKGLFFLGPNDTFDKLAMHRVVDGPVILGSGVKVPGRSLIRKTGGIDGTAGDGNDGFLCIANRRITACYSDGSAALITDDRYHVAEAVDEVAATFRDVDGTSQYIAVPQ